MISKNQIKHIRSLHQKKYRDKNQQFFVEGFKIVKEALQYSPDSILEIFSTTSLPFSVPSTIRLTEIEKKDLQQISALQHPQDVLAICKYLPAKEENFDFFIALDKVQDPGNLGTILRLAAWFAIPSIVASKDTVDCYNPKTVQASMGAVFNVKVAYKNLEEVLANTHLPIYGAVLEGENIYKIKKERKGVLLMGNEGSGIRKELLPYISDSVSIPKYGKGESLNVAMATAIFLSEFSR